MSEDLIKRLEARYASLVKEAGEKHAQVAELLANDAEPERRAAIGAEADKAIADAGEVKAQIDKLSDQAKREKRAAKAAAGGGEQRGDPGTGSVTVISEPTTYGAGSGHSYFLDMARDQLNRGDGDSGVQQARQRLKRHAVEVDKAMPERRALVERRAAKAFEEKFTSSPEDERRLSEMDRMGVSPFERRFISRTDGQGGYFVPPLWLIDQFIPYLRAGRVFANMWQNFPLPSGTDSINIPRITTGTATGPQTSDGGPVPGRDAADNFVNAIVRTVAGQQDAAIQLLDQSPVAFDQIIFKDLMMDYGMQLSAQLMVGSNSNGQLTGLYTTGALGTSGGASASGFVVNNTAAAWTAAAGTANFYTSIGQLLSNIARTRFRPVTGIISHPMVWYAYSTAVDSQNRPLVAVQQQANFFNAAGQQDTGAFLDGPTGHVLGVPWITDPNIPITFGGTGATQPFIGATSSGNVGPTAGSGGTAGNSNVFTPAIAAVWPDLYLWEGDMRSRVLSEVLSGTLQVRFQVYGYVADMPNRYQNSSNQPVSYGNYNTIGTQATVLSTGTGGLLINF